MCIAQIALPFFKPNFFHLFFFTLSKSAKEHPGKHSYIPPKTINCPFRREKIAPNHSGKRLQPPPPPPTPPFRQCPWKQHISKGAFLRSGDLGKETETGNRRKILKKKKKSTSDLVPGRCRFFFFKKMASLNVVLNVHCDFTQVERRTKMLLSQDENSRNDIVFQWCKNLHQKMYLLAYNIFLFT